MNSDQYMDCYTVGADTELLVVREIVPYRAGE